MTLTIENNQLESFISMQCETNDIEPNKYIEELLLKEIQRKKFLNEIKESQNDIKNNRVSDFDFNDFLNELEK
jgi:hypothetical protein